MKTSTDKTHPAYAVDPVRFRAMATGIGQSQSMSLATGSLRSHCVVAAMPQAQKAALTAASGYPTGAEALGDGCVVSDDGC